MRPLCKPDTHKEAALYWSAVGLMVCEGCSVEEAASQLGVEGEDLRLILQRRSTNSPFDNFTSSYMDRLSRRELS
jgi:hypothetical protein